MLAARTLHAQGPPVADLGGNGAQLSSWELSGQGPSQSFGFADPTVRTDEGLRTGIRFEIRRDVKV